MSTAGFATPWKQFVVQLGSLAAAAGSIGLIRWFEPLSRTPLSHPMWRAQMTDLGTFYGFFLVLALFAALEGGFSFKTHATGRKVLPSKSPALSKNPSRAFSTSAGPDSLGAKWLKILVGVQGFEPWTR
jgi:hypothetical protein